jgi:thiol-disulfide isomerase/thioredoxin
MSVLLIAASPSAHSRTAALLQAVGQRLTFRGATIEQCETLSSSKLSLMSPISSRLLIACFCAAWCRTCDDYVRVFEMLKQRYAQDADVVWVDIEDQADLIDDVDVENFPTLLISDAQQVYFWGTVLPHANTATQLVGRVLAGDIRKLTDAAIAELDQRLRDSF